MKAIMIVGTTSHAGKSMLVTAICRILARQEKKVAPFKGQNMALNAYVTSSGGEMGYAQALQAWSAMTKPSVHMNPILLKPQGNMTSQVIIHGKVIGSMGASEYYENCFDQGWEAITNSLKKLADKYEVLVIEGAGSPAEPNLKARDLTNMRIAKYLNAPTLLVVDIDRGGAFAHIVGTLELLDDEERSLIKGIVINKFRGQRSLLEPGIIWLQERIKIPVIGVIPWIYDLFPSEDSLSLLERTHRDKSQAEITIAIIQFPRISNFTDFDPLEAETTVKIKYIHPNDHLGHPDAVILPGTKTTVADLINLQESGMAKQIQNYVKSGGTILGICGGFQMLGKMVYDPQGLEGVQEKVTGLSLLPISTMMTNHKISRQRTTVSKFPQPDLPIQGYEIHQGKTKRLDWKEIQIEPLFEDISLGMVNQNYSVWGTYLHGLFDNSAWRRSWLNHLRHQRGLSSLPTGIPNYEEQRELLLNNIADLVNQHLDLSWF